VIYLGVCAHADENSKLEPGLLLMANALCREEHQRLSILYHSCRHFLVGWWCPGCLRCVEPLLNQRVLMFFIDEHQWQRLQRQNEEFHPPSSLAANLISRMATMNQNRKSLTLSCPCLSVPAQTSNRPSFDNDMAPPHPTPTIMGTTRGPAPPPLS